MTVIGIDPGAKGGIAVIRSDGTASAFAFNLQTYREIIQLEHSRARAIVESVHAMPKQGVSSTFMFGRNFGTILGLLYAFDVPTTLVDPRAWKKKYGLHSDKSESIAVAHKMFPDVNLFASSRCKVMHDGMAEALLIAAYGIPQQYPINTLSIPTEKSRV